MEESTTFLQPCPICGRGVLIPVQSLGQQVACSHCRGEFQARDTSHEFNHMHRATIMERADDLLARSSVR